MDMGLNSKHHSGEEGETPAVHVHNDGKRHIHQNPPGQKKPHNHEMPHTDAQASNQDKSASDKDNCCTGTVKQFQDVDKSIPNSVTVVHPVFLTAFIASYYNISLLPYTDVVKDIKPFVRSYHPPIPDIRLAIQSFQI